MSFELAKGLREPLHHGPVDLLVADHEDTMAQEGVVDDAHDIVGQGLGEVGAGHLGAEAAGEGRHHGAGRRLRFVGVRGSVGLRFGHSRLHATAAFRPARAGRRCGGRARRGR
jgi:hypothetical protein